MWTVADVTFDLVDEDTDHPVVTASIATPLGLLMLMAEPVEESDGRTLRLLRVHVDSTPGSNRLGAVALRSLARLAMERMDYDEIIVEGAVRTTGAGPGRTPRPIRFIRRRRAAAGS